MYSLFSENEEIIFKYICRHNYVTNVQISKFLDRTTSYISHLMKDYIDGDYIGKKGITRKLTVYYAKQKLINVMGLNYKAISKVNLIQINHSLTLNDLENFLVNKEKKDIWYTEREIYYGDIFDLNLKKIFESPDGVIERNGRRYAVELELSKKTIERWNNKLYFYNTLIEKGFLNGVLYYTFDEYIKNKLNILKMNFSFQNRIEINNLSGNEIFKSYTLV